MYQRRMNRIRTTMDVNRKITCLPSPNPNVRRDHLSLHLMTSTKSYTGLSHSTSRTIPSLTNSFLYATINIRGLPLHFRTERETRYRL